jgi:hypothetical protein
VNGLQKACKRCGRSYEGPISSGTGLGIRGCLAMGAEKEKVGSANLRPGLDVKVSGLDFAGSLRVSVSSKEASLRFAVAMHEQRIVGNRFFDELLEEEQFRAVDDCVDAELERLHGRESLERVAE